MIRSMQAPYREELGPSRGHLNLVAVGFTGSALDDTWRDFGQLPAYAFIEQGIMQQSDRYSEA